MSRLKKCAYDNVLDDYEELANYKSCRNCKHFCATQKVPCQQRFLWHFYQSDGPTGEFWARLGAKPRLKSAFQILEQTKRKKNTMTTPMLEAFTISSRKSFTANMRMKLRLRARKKVQA